MTDDPTTTNYFLEALRLIVAVIIGAGGKGAIDWLKDRNKTKAEAKKLDAETQNIRTSQFQQSFQIADESLQEFMTIARTATKDLVVVTRELGNVYIYVDKVTDYVDDVAEMLQKLAGVLETCQAPGYEKLKDEVANLLTEREKLREEREHIKPEVEMKDA